MLRLAVATAVLEAAMTVSAQPPPPPPPPNPPARAELQDVQEAGGYDPDVLRDAVRAAAAEIGECAESELGGMRRVTLRLLVARSGRIAGATVEGSSGVAAIDRCVASRVQQLRLPRRRGAPHATVIATVVIADPTPTGALGPVTGSPTDVLRGTGNANAAGVAEVRAGPPAIRGRLDRDQIHQVVRQHLADVLGCYERGVAEVSGMQGRVEVVFIIGWDGEIQTAIISNSSLSHAVTEQCVASVVRRWSFPQPAEGTVRVQYPFVFRMTPP